MKTPHCDWWGPLSNESYTCETEVMKNYVSHVSEDGDNSGTSDESN